MSFSWGNSTNNTNSTNNSSWTWGNSTNNVTNTRHDTSSSADYGMERSNSLKVVQQQIFADIVKNDKYRDVTFIIGEQATNFHVNRMFLSAISAVFDAMLYGNMEESKPNAEIAIKDINPVGFECVLNFAYNNDPKITPQNVLSVIQICDKYQITSLRSFCDEYLKSSKCLPSVCALLEEAITLKLDDSAQRCVQCLRHICNGWTMENIESELIQLSLKAMTLFLQTDCLRITEDELWQYVLKWTEYQCNDTSDMDNNTGGDVENDRKENRKHLLKSVKQYIRFGLMSGQYFVNNVIAEQILTQSELIDILSYLFGNKENECGGFNTTQRGV